MKTSCALAIDWLAYLTSESFATKHAIAAHMQRMPWRFALSRAAASPEGVTLALEHGRARESRRAAGRYHACFLSSPSREYAIPLRLPAATFLRGPASPGVSHLLHHQRARDDGRQHRARHQLLDDAREVRLARARRLRGDLALGAIPAVLGLVGGARGPVRPAPPGPGRHAALHRRIARLGILPR